MAKSPLESAIATWNKRHAYLASKGIPTSAYKELAHKDINRIKSTGGTVLSGPEASVAIKAAVTGKPQLEKKRDTGVMGVLKNFPTDIGDIIWNLPAGLARFAGAQVTSKGEVPEFVQTLTSPEHRAEMGMEGSEGGIFGLLRNLQRAPITRLIPGTHTLGSLTTSEGRKELQRHPAVAALDVLSVAAPGGRAGAAAKIAPEGSKVAAGIQGLVSRQGAKLAGEGIIGKEAVAAEKAANKMASNLNAAEEVAEAEALTVTGSKVKPGSGPKTAPTEAQVAQARNTADGLKKDVGKLSHAGQALLEGNPVKAAFRTAGGVTDTGMPRTSSAMRTLARKMNISKDIREVVGTGLQVEGRNVSRDLSHEFENVIKPMWEGMDEAELSAATGVLQQLNRGQLDDLIRNLERTDPAKAEWLSEVAAKGELTRSFMHDMALKAENAGTGKYVTGIDPDGRPVTEFYTMDHPVVRAEAKMVRTQDRLGKLQTEEINILLNPNSSLKKRNGIAKRIETQRAKVTEANNKFNKTMMGAKGAPRRFKPLLEEQIKGAAKETVEQDPMAYQKMGLEATLRSIDNATEFTELRSILGDTRWKEIWNDTVGSWTKLIDEGFDPVYLPHVKPGTSVERLMYVRPIAARETVTPAMWKRSAFNFSPGLSDVAMSITQAAKDFLTREGTETYYQTYWDPIGKTAKELKDEYVTRAENAGDLAPRESILTRATELRDKEWKPLPSGYRPKASLGGEQKLYPAYMVEAIGKIVDQSTKQLPLYLDEINRGMMKTYRTAVLTSPRHLSHVALGGSMMAMGYYPVGYWKNIPRAWKIVKGDLQDTALNSHLYHPTPDQLWGTASGKTLGRLFGSLGNKLDQFKKFEENVANMQRVSVQLAGEAKGLPRAEAIQIANRIMVSLDDMSPMERTILKQVAPFYAFSRHVMRYLMRFPVDHPYRAAFLARLAEQEAEEQKLGLNNHFSMMFFLGQPDRDGNIKTVDFKSVNPFRTLDNDFTLAGFVSSLHPAVQWIGSASGLKMLTATPELHQELSIDPNTGALVAKRKNLWMTGLETFIPQTETVDHMVQFTDRMRYMKANNPGAYESTLYSSLGIPFEGALPGKGIKNVPYERASEERNRYKYAQQQVTKSLQTGSTAPIKGYAEVPMPGVGLVAPESIQALLARTKPPEGVSPKAVIPRAR